MCHFGNKFDEAVLCRIETRRQCVVKTSTILDLFGSPISEVPDHMNRPAWTSRSILQISRNNGIDPSNRTQFKYIFYKDLCRCLIVKSNGQGDSSSICDLSYLMILLLIWCSLRMPAVDDFEIVFLTAMS